MRLERRRYQAALWVLPVVAIAIVAATVWPVRHAGLFSDDYNWLNNYALGNLHLGGPFYDLGHHGNPLPVEVQWYRLHFSLFRFSGTEHHTFDLGCHLAVLALFFGLLIRLGVSRASAAGATLLAGLAPAAVGVYGWVSASPHLWATLLALAAIHLYLSWRASERPIYLALSLILTVGAVLTKNDGLLAPVFVVVHLWSEPTSSRPRAALVSGAYAAAAALFVLWEASAHDSIRSSAHPTPGSALSNLGNLLRLTLLPHDPGRLHEVTGVSSAIAVALAWMAAVAVGGLALASLTKRPGRVLLLAGLVTTVPILVLREPVVFRYAYPLVLCVLGAAAIGLDGLSRRQPGFRRSIEFGVACLAIGVIAYTWGALTRNDAIRDGASNKEGNAMLAAVSASNVNLSKGGSLELLGSPLDGNTARFRFEDPRLPSNLHSTLVTVGPEPPPHVVVARQLDGSYIVTHVSQGYANGGRPGR